MKHDPAYGETLKAPVNVTWEITGQCNLRCRHCLSSDLMDACEGEMGFDECLKFIDDLDRLEVFQINFGGGEPFLRKDFLDILDYAHDRKITTCVSTNGTLISAELARRLAAMDYLYIQVSLDGATAETNDAIRGNWTFGQATRGMKFLVDAGFQNLSTNTVVTAVNFREIVQIYELGRTYGVKTRLSRFRPSGSAKRVWDEYHLDKAQLQELSEFLSAKKDVLTGDSFFAITAKDRRELGLNMCGAAKMTCGVTPEGDVYPCAFMTDRQFTAGNITRQSLGEIWRDAPVMKMIRGLRVESCESCVRFNLCHGGCPAVAYYLTRSLDHPDPECMNAFPERFMEQESNNGVTTHVRTI